MPALREKVALVTGAAGIIGPDICSSLKEAGWKVAAADLRREGFALYENTRHRSFPADLQLSADLAHRTECLGLIDEARSLGPLALVVHGATGSIRRPLAQLDEATCERLLHIDVFAPLYLAQAARADLAKTRGLIVHLSSVRLQAIEPGTLLYSVAKAAVEKMVECLAIELAPQGVRVNGIRIGAVSGDAFLRPAMALLPPELATRLREEIMPLHLEAAKGYALTGRAGSPLDIAEMILHLVSPAGMFINGAILPVDGAFNLVRSMGAFPPESPHIKLWYENPREQVQKWLKEKGISHEV
jgi:NAD(P)-dependent dehydrogenase (short-subunit alcohol dehydrogenase family)